VRDWKFGKLRDFPNHHRCGDLPGMWDPKNATSPRFFRFDSSKTGEVLI